MQGVLTVFVRQEGRRDMEHTALGLTPVDSHGLVL
jgi:hypothetical protein